MIPLPGEGWPGRRAAAVRRAGLRVAAAVGCGVVLGAAVGFAGSFGLVIAADCLAGLALLLLVVRVPEGGRGRLWPRWFWPRTRRRPPVESSDFPAYQKISSDLGWAAVSRWHYDHGTRRLLTRIMQAALAERHRVDLAADPARARALTGEDVWPFLDPAAPPCHDSRVPGPDLRMLTRIVDRLERL